MENINAVVEDDAAELAGKYDLYESFFTSHFFRLWGQREQALGIPEAQSILLGNAQNFLDAAFGDVSGNVGRKFFLIEFKRTREGIAEEVKNKIHRKELFKKLQTDESCIALANRGHFAGFPSSEEVIIFEPYFQAALPIPKLIDGKSWCFSFNELFDRLNKSEEVVTDAEPNISGFVQGLGLTKIEFEKYILCMYEHLEPHITENSGSEVEWKIMFGVFDKKTGEVYGFVEDFPTLLNHLYKRFTAAAKLNNRRRQKGPGHSGGSGS